MTDPTACELSKRLPARLQRWTPQLLAAELCYEVDAALLAAVMDRESLGGDALNPKGPAGKGDKGNGHGLMQLDIRHHRLFLCARFDDFLECWTEPTFNVLYGARLLRRLFTKFKGDVAAAVAAYNAGTGPVSLVLAKLSLDAPLGERVAALDRVTTGKDYVSDVLRRRANFAGEPLV